MTFYKYEDLFESVNPTLSVQCDTLTLTFRWPMFTQTLRDQLLAEVDKSMRSDPLIGEVTETPVRTYDYLDYYLNQVPDVDVIDWITEQTVLPQSIRKLSVTQQYSILLARKAAAVTTQAILNDYDELLHWQCTIDDGVNDPTVCAVQKGAWINHQEDDWWVSFSYPDDKLDYDRIGTLTVIAGVADAED